MKLLTTIAVVTVLGEGMLQSPIGQFFQCCGTVAVHVSAGWLAALIVQL